MSSRKRARAVYSTDAGRTCPRCGWPARDCSCAASRDEPLPEHITARLLLERKGRKGKTVTVVYGLPRNRSFLKELAGNLKRGCGTGGSVADDAILIQGDQRDRIRDLLTARGITVKG